MIFKLMQYFLPNRVAQQTYVTLSNGNLWNIVKQTMLHLAVSPQITSWVQLQWKTC